MSRISTLWLLCLLALPACGLFGGPEEPPIAPPSPPLSGDYQRLQGTWVVTYNELRTVPLPEMEGELFIFESDHFRLGSDDGDEWFAIDETSEPKRIDFYDRRSPIVRGIYRLDGDSLVICSGAPGAARPKAFETSAFSGAVLTKVTRK